jgi:hypothetical protein
MALLGVSGSGHSGQPIVKMSSYGSLGSFKQKDTNKHRHIKNPENVKKLYAKYP